MLIALALITFGALFLLRNTGILPGVAWDVTWPLVVLILGVALLLGRPRNPFGFAPRTRKPRS